MVLHQALVTWNCLWRRMDIISTRTLTKSLLILQNLPHRLKTQKPLAQRRAIKVEMWGKTKLDNCLLYSFKKLFINSCKLLFSWWFWRTNRNGVYSILCVLFIVRVRGDEKSKTGLLFSCASKQNPPFIQFLWSHRRIYRFYWHHFYYIFLRIAVEKRLLISISVLCDALVSTQETKVGIQEPSAIDSVPLFSSTHHAKQKDVEVVPSKTQSPTIQTRCPESQV